MSINHRTLVVLFGLLLLAGCAAPKPSAEEENKALVNRFGDALNARDFVTVQQLLTSDFVRHSQATPDLSVANAAQFLDYLKADASAFPDARQTLEHVVAEGDLVAFWGAVRGDAGRADGSLPAIAQAHAAGLQWPVPGPRRQAGRALGYLGQPGGARTTWVLPASCQATVTCRLTRRVQLAGATKRRDSLVRQWGSLHWRNAIR